MSDTKASPSFHQELRRALYHLYDPARLRQSPLIEFLQLAQSSDPSSNLRQILLEAIAALKPDVMVPAKSNAWRVYRLLLQRFAEQFSQQDVATDLALSIRQLRRDESLALEVLADYLWTHYNLSASSLEAHPHHNDRNDSATRGGTPSRELELEWLRKTEPGEVVDINEGIATVLELIAPLAQGSRVNVLCNQSKNLASLVVRPTAMRQALISVLTAAIKLVPGGQVTIQAKQIGRDICISIALGLRRGPSPVDNRQEGGIGFTNEDLTMARQLVSLAGGYLEVAAGAGQGKHFVVDLFFPATEGAGVLVIDDNVDTLQLLERYVAATRYHFIAVSDPQRAIALAEETAPQVIVLDVMLPRIDGWELLGRLRAHPRTQAIPIIVCTILPQEQLALALGAAAFIQKPVDRAAFLSAIERLTV
jgi:CheY-like chemotaxis protein